MTTSAQPGGTGNNSKDAATGRADNGSTDEFDREEQRERAGELAQSDDVLGVVVRALEQSGFTGSPVTAVLVFLTICTRLFQRPVSVILGGPPSAGKSFAIEKALAFHPPEAYFVMTGMSDKALLYLKESLKHRMLVVMEAAGLTGDFLMYGVRSLLSEGKLEYWYTDFEHRRARHLVKEGPTGLVSSSARAVDHELATRVLMPTVKDDAELTRAIMLETAREDQREEPDYAPFHALQRFIASGPTAVTIPYAELLAKETDPTAVRMRRDFTAVLSLTRAHALLHQGVRERDATGRVVAVPADYAAVHRLVAEMVAEGTERSVPATVRETADAVRSLYYHRTNDDQPVTLAALAKQLGLTRPSILRRVNRALTLGYVRDQGAGGRGRQKLLVPGDPMPEDAGVLPSPEILG